MQVTFHVYTLTNPENGEIFYVGMTGDLKTRLSTHLRKPFRVTCKREEYLYNMSCYPVMDVVETITVEVKLHYIKATEEALLLEAAWIEKLREEGHPLTNKKVSRKMSNQLATL